MSSDLLRALCALGVFVLPMLMAWGYLARDDLISWGQSTLTSCSFGLSRKNSKRATARPPVKAAH